jgi:outer membrane protein OmpA-like peptidoglycan-associated protein
MSASPPLLDEDESIALRLVGALITILLVGVLAFGVNQARKPKLATIAPSPAAAAHSDSDQRVIVREDGRVIFYFGNASSTLAAEGDTALARIVSETQSGKTAVLSGFHDSSGDPALNAELAKQRALAVQASLLRLGVSAERIDLQEPMETLGGADAAEARRVEVALR